MVKAIGRAVDWMANKRYLPFTGAAGSIVVAVGDLLAGGSEAAVEVQGVGWYAAIPFLLAFVQQRRVWAPRTVDEIRAEYRARLDV